MSAINPFYRFEVPDANAGFFPECNRVSASLNALYFGFYDVLFQFQNVSWSFANKSLKALIAQYNGLPWFGNFVIEYPSPFPALTGIQQFEIKVYNKQLRAVFPGQELTIVVDTDDTEVFMTIVANVPILSITATTTDPLIPEEAKAINGLNTINANGRAYFERPYFYDSTAELAKSSLIRGKTWEFNQTYNRPIRENSSSPIEMAFRPKLPKLTEEVIAIISVMNQVLKAAWEELPYNDVSDAFNALVDNYQFPDGWLTDNYGNLTSKLEFTIYKTDLTIKYVGKLVGDSFKFQRFIGFVDNPAFYIIDTNSLSPFPIVSDIQFYYGLFYDFDMVDWGEQCIEIDESYQMPIKPGDELSFIVPMAQGNIFELTNAKVGLFTDSGVFVQKVGDAALDLPTTECTSFTFLMYPVNQYLGFPQDIGFGIGQLPTNPNTIMTLDYSFDLDYGGDYPGTAEEWMDAMVAGFPANEGTITYAEVGVGEFGRVFSVTWTLYQTFNPGVVASWGVMLGATMDAPELWDTEFGQQYGEAIDCSISVCQRFMSANVTIPSRPTGCYRFGLYNINAESDEYNLYSLSNLLRLDASDCYSTILEFYGNDNSVNQGFYYASTWKHRIRLGINGGGAKPKLEENIYRQSNGVFKRPSNKLDYTLDLHTDFLDEPTQKALVDATRHDFFIWNGENVFVEGDIDVATIQDFTTQSSFEKLAQVKFSVLIQNYQPNNNACFSC